MSGYKCSVVVALALALAGASAAKAQIPGMPLFTNPRYATGLRVHADLGQPTKTETSLGDLTVVQGGASFVLGPVGIGANVGAVKNDIDQIQACQDSPTLECEGTKITASVLAQIRLAGGGRHNYSFSVFGGASRDITARQVAGVEEPIQLTIPVGAAVGLRVPLGGVASLNLWGAPRLNVFKFTNCDSSTQSLCDETETKFRWAVGADLPIFRVLSIRAAFDSGKIGDETVSVWGVGASIGIGGMR